MPKMETRARKIMNNEAGAAFGHSDLFSLVLLALSLILIVGTVPTYYSESKLANYHISANLDDRKLLSRWG